MTESLIGHTFGEWTVIQQLSASKYLCQCSCGTQRIYPKSDILRERSYHCGCKRYDLSSPYHSKHVPDYRGKRFGRLTAIDYVEVDGQRKWLCRCNCGKEIYASTYLLRIGNVQSCGCFKSESSRLNARKALANNTVAFGTDLKKIRKSVMNCKGRGQTGYRGVFPCGNKKYRARITFRKKVYDLGVFAHIEDAIAARKEAEDQLYGNFLAWYEKEGKGKRERAVKERNEVVAEEAREFFKGSAKEDTREKYSSSQRCY